MLPCCCCCRLQIIMRGLRASCDLAVKRLKELAITVEGTGPESREVLEKCAGTALNSKLISQHKVGALSAARATTLTEGYVCIH